MFDGFFIRAKEAIEAKLSASLKEKFSVSIEAAPVPHYDDADWVLVVWRREKLEDRMSKALPATALPYKGNNVKKMPVRVKDLEPSFGKFDEELLNKICHFLEHEKDGDVTTVVRRQRQIRTSIIQDTKTKEYLVNVPLLSEAQEGVPQTYTRAVWSPSSESARIMEKREIHFLICTFVKWEPERQISLVPISLVEIQDYSYRWDEEQGTWFGEDYEPIDTWVVKELVEKDEDYDVSVDYGRRIHEDD
jgi:hypothetical protein